MSRYDRHPDDRPSAGEAERDLYLDTLDAGVTTDLECRWCGYTLHLDGGVWVDHTEGDTCALPPWADDNLNHEPRR